MQGQGSIGAAALLRLFSENTLLMLAFPVAIALRCRLQRCGAKCICQQIPVSCNRFLKSACEAAPHCCSPVEVEVFATCRCFQRLPPRFSSPILSIASSITTELPRMTTMPIGFLVPSLSCSEASSRTTFRNTCEMLLVRIRLSSTIRSDLRRIRAALQ